MQQSESMMQGLDASRQAPEPRSHRPVRSQESPPAQHGLPPPSTLQPSPVGRHTDDAGAHVPPPSQRAEQHWLLTMHDPPAVTHSGPPHVPPLHPSEQHSLGSSHWVPFA
jgi:hypothetical protein